MNIFAGMTSAALLTGRLAGLSAPPTEAQPAPVNPYNGMQTREEVFEFAQKPAVKREGDKWVITFASKGACDATVSIVDKDGKVVRHLATGVLGKNAPWPFQQNSLAQKIEWDGLTSDFKKADPAGCRVRVSLGLKPEFDRNIFPPPHQFLRAKPSNGFVKTATDDKGNVFVAALDGGLVFGHVFDKDGKYLRTFWPPAAKDVEKVGVKLTTTIWGDKTPWAGWSGPFHDDPKHGGGTVKAMLSASGLAPEQFKDGPWPASLPKATKYADLQKMHWVWFQKWSRLVVDPRAKAVYGAFEGMALSEETGDVIPDAPIPLAVGPDWCVSYGSWGSPGMRVLMRWAAGTIPKKKGHTPQGAIPWPEGQTWDKERTFLWTGQINGGNGCNNCGWDITERGEVVQKILGNYIMETDIPQAVIDAKALEKGPGKDEDCKAIEAAGAHIPPGHNHSPGYCHVVQVLDRNGKCLTRNAVENLANMASISMDREGSLYVSQGPVLPPGQKFVHGVADTPMPPPRAAWGSIWKFRGQGGKYPLGKVWWGKGLDAKGNPKEAAPTDALQMADGVKASGALWSYGGLSSMVESGSCECGQATYNQDNWGRLWVPNNAVCGVMVVDPNGNFVMRVGKYGNADDAEADRKEKRDGCRFAWIRSVFATDEALYVHDYDNARLDRIALKYAVEETVPVP